MTLTTTELRTLARPLAIGLGLLIAGAALVGWMNHEFGQTFPELAKAEKTRKTNEGTLALISVEEREVKEKMAFYQRLGQAGILGEERRLEWADAITRIRTSRELLDLRYRIEPQKVLISVAEKPASVDFFVSTMKLELALLHEGDLLAMLADLRDSGNQYTSVQRCNLSRSGLAPPAAASLAPRLRAQCEVNLITIIDRAAKRS